MSEHTERKSWPIWKAVARSGDEILVADEAFSYGDFHGVVGTHAYGVTQAMLDERRRDKHDQATIREEAKELGITQSAFRSIPMKEWIDWGFEEADPRAVAAVRALPGFDEATYPRIATSGGGRCFGHKIMEPRTVGTVIIGPYEPIDADLLRKINDFDDNVTQEWTP